MIVLWGVLFISSLLMACAQVANPIEKSSSQGAKTTEVQAPGKAPWEEEWKKYLAQAKREGVIVIYSPRSEALREILAKAFIGKFGINIEWVAGRDAQLNARLFSERRAGLFLADVRFGGAISAVTVLKPAGILEHLRPQLILPEVKDPEVWWGGRLPFFDKEETTIFTTLYPQSPLLLNTNLVKRDEIGSYQDLLHPRWRGKILSEDPTQPGSALKWFSVMIEPEFGPVLGLDYMKKLASQDLVILRDERLSLEWLLRGKYPLGLNLSIVSQLAEYLRQGIRVPIESYTPREGGYVTIGGQNINLFKNAPHPAAARVFINWILTREGQIAIEKASIKHSARLDLPLPNEIDPQIIVREPGVNYINAEREEFLLKTEEYVKQAKEIFGQLLK